ncbi:hypothetical protein [Amycolatopsis solani]|uniref:hypothetical protein n=1 Tax=Amycolatopsis solani TaxID=3028615 RepID=UPI0025AF9B9F|nr:hypothetical protein [Amycolatopsis sp. MEP2-6]
MDPISLIVGVLVQGLLEGVKDSAREAVTDGCRALRESIARRYGGQVARSVELLERHPESAQCREAVARELRNAGADRDPQLVALAEQLRVLVEDPRGAEDPVEKVQRSSALGTIRQLLDGHIAQVLAVRSRHSVEVTDLLSANIGRVPSIDQQVRAGVAGLHGRIRAVIEQVAAHIENQRYQDVETAVRELPAGFAEREWAYRLVQTEKRMHVSYESLRLTVEFLSALNQSILGRIERESSAQRLSDMMFGNAIVIYELTDFVIGYIRGFAISGDLDQLHREAKDRVDQTREEQRALEERVRGESVPAAMRDQVLEDIRARESAFREIDREWEKYLGEVREMREKAEGTRAILPALEIFRDNARIQIMTLQLVAMLRVLKQNSASIRSTVDTLQGFRLAPLSPTRVHRLLGMETDLP